MFGLYSGLLKTTGFRKRLFFRGVGGRFALPLADFLPFCLAPSCREPPQSAKQPLQALLCPCLALPCPLFVPPASHCASFVSSKTLDKSPQAKRKGSIPPSLPCLNNFCAPIRPPQYAELERIEQNLYKK